MASTLGVNDLGQSWVPSSGNPTALTHGQQYQTALTLGFENEPDGGAQKGFGQSDLTGTWRQAGGLKQVVDGNGDSLGLARLKVSVPYLKNTARSNSGYDGARSTNSWGYLNYNLRWQRTSFQKFSKSDIFDVTVGGKRKPSPYYWGQGPQIRLTTGKLVGLKLKPYVTTPIQAIYSGSDDLYPNSYAYYTMAGSASNTAQNVLATLNSPALNWIDQQVVFDKPFSWVDSGFKWNGTPLQNDSITMDFWLYTPSLHATAYNLMQFRRDKTDVSANYHAVRFVVSGNDIWFKRSDGSAIDQKRIASVTHDRWNHYEFAYDKVNKNLCLWINGQPVLMGKPATGNTGYALLEDTSPGRTESPVIDFLTAASAGAIGSEQAAPKVGLYGLRLCKGIRHSLNQPF